MKKTECYQAALAFLEERTRLIAELTVGGEDALTALAIVLISAGYDRDQILHFTTRLMGREWMGAMLEVLDRGCEGPDQIWGRHNGDPYPLPEKSLR